MPMCTFHRNEDQELCVDGVPLASLTATYGTPLYVYSAAGVISTFTNFQQAVAPVSGKVHFAMKANSALGILALIGKLGGGVDIVAIGEMKRAVAAGIAPTDMVFSGVGKTDDEIRQALLAGIGQINAESAPELDAISRVATSLGVIAPVALRVNVDVAPATHTKISTGQRDTKFGISSYQDEAANLYHRLANDTHIKPAGLAVHIGSQIRDLSPFERAYKALLDLANGLRSNGLSVPGLDLGGGIGVDYETGGAPDFSGYGALVTALFKDQDYKLGFEPGRSIIANNGVLLTRVIRVKKGDGKRFVITDAAMNDLLRPTLYEAYHKIVPVAAPGAPAGPADIVGPICETGDYLGLDRDLPEIASGAQLAVLSAGAYGAVMASHYNSRSPAAEVLVHDSTAHLLRAARPIEELIADESTPNFIGIDGR